ncbi:MAG: Flp pilus assembly protein CpaB [Myxococcota bacterium]
MPWEHKKKRQPWKVPEVATSRKALFGVVGGCLLGLVGFAALQTLIEDYKSRIDAAAAPVETAFVMVAARELAVGVRVDIDDVFAVALPVEHITPDMARIPQQIVGRYPRERILPNEFIRSQRLADPDRGDGLNALLPREMRALSIELSNGAALSGHLQPGSYVDVLATVFPDGEEEEVTTTLVQGLFILAVNERSIILTPQEEREARQIPRPSVTFLVTPEEAEKVTLAERTAMLHLALRNDLDDKYAETHGVDVDALLGRLGLKDEEPVATVARAPRAPEPPPVVAEEPVTHAVRMISGSKVSTVETQPDPALPAGSTR